MEKNAEKLLLEIRDLLKDIKRLLQERPPGDWIIYPYPLEPGPLNPTFWCNHQEQ